MSGRGASRYRELKLLGSVDQTQRCWGTARTVRTDAGSWLLDVISIDCAPD